MIKNISNNLLQILKYRYLTIETYIEIIRDCIYIEK